MSISDALSSFVRKRIAPLPSVQGGPGSRHGKGAWRFVTRRTGEKVWTFVYGATPQAAYASPSVDNTDRAVVGVAPEGPSATALQVGAETESHYGVDTEHEDDGSVTINGQAIGAGDVEGMAEKNFEHVAQHATLDEETQTEEDSTIQNENGVITYPHALQMIAVDIIVHRIIANIAAPERTGRNDTNNVFVAGKYVQGTGDNFAAELNRDGADMLEISEEDRQSAIERGEVIGPSLRGWRGGEQEDRDVSEGNPQFIGPDHELNVNKQKGLLNEIIKNLSKLSQAKDPLTEDEFNQGVIDKNFYHASFEEILKIIEKLLPASIANHLSKSQQEALIAEHRDLFDENGNVKPDRGEEWKRICQEAILMDALETANAFAVSCKEKGWQIIPITSPDLPSSLSGYASEENSRAEEAKTIAGGGSLVFYFKGDRSLLKGDIVSAWGDSVPTITEQDEMQIGLFLEGKIPEVNSALETKIKTIFDRLSMTQYKDFKFDSRVLDGTIDMREVLDEIEENTEEYTVNILNQAIDISNSGKVFAVTDQAVISEGSAINPDSIIARSGQVKAIIIPSRASEYFDAKNTVVSLEESRKATERKQQAINTAKKYREEVSAQDPSLAANEEAAMLLLPSSIKNASGATISYQQVVDSFPKLKSTEKFIVFRDLEAQIADEAKQKRAAVMQSNPQGAQGTAYAESAEGYKERIDQEVSKLPSGAKNILDKIKANLLPVEAALYSLRSYEQAKAIEKIKEDFYLSAMTKHLPRNPNESSASYSLRISQTVNASFEKLVKTAKKSAENLPASYFAEKFSDNNNRLWQEIELATMSAGSKILAQLTRRQKDVIAANPKLPNESDADYAKKISTLFSQDPEIVQKLAKDLRWDKNQQKLANTFVERTKDPASPQKTSDGYLSDLMCAAGTRNHYDDVEWFGLAQKAVKSQLAGIATSKSDKDKQRVIQIAETINAFCASNNIPLIPKDANLGYLLTNPESIKAYQMYCDANDIKIIHFDSYEYPAALRQLGADAPAIIYAKGNWGLLGTKSVACVGTHQSDANIINPVRNHIENTIRHLGQKGYTIVSGLANGIDFLSHQAALKHGAPTIAVVAGGVDGGDWGERGKREQLYNEILAKNGLIISESPIGINNDNKNMGDLLVQRNRIQAGLSAGTIAFLTAETKHSSVLLAANKSADTGTMHTVKDTVHYGRFLATVDPTIISYGKDQQHMKTGNSAIVRKHGGFSIRPSDGASLQELSDNLDEHHKAILQKSMNSGGISSFDVFSEGMSDENRDRQHAVSWENLSGVAHFPYSGRDGLKAVLSPFPPEITKTHLAKSAAMFGSQTPKSISDIDIKAVKKQWKKDDKRRRFGRYEGDTIKQKLSKAAIDFGTSINSPAMQKLRIMAGRTKSKIIVLDNSKSGSKLIGGKRAPKMSWSRTNTRGEEVRSYPDYKKIDHGPDTEEFNWGNNVTVNPADSGVAALEAGGSFLSKEGEEYAKMDEVRAGKIKKSTSGKHSIAKFSITGTPLKVRITKRTYTAYKGVPTKPATVSHIELFLDGNLVAQYRKGSVFNNSGSEWASTYKDHLAKIDDSNINYGLSMAAEYIARRQNAFSQAKTNKTKQGSGLSDTGMENPHIFPGNSPLREDSTQSGNAQSGEHTNFEIKKEAIVPQSIQQGNQPIYNAPDFAFGTNGNPDIMTLNNTQANGKPAVAYFADRLAAHMIPVAGLPVSLRTTFGDSKKAAIIAKQIATTLNLRSSGSLSSKWLQNLQIGGTRLAFVPSSVWQYKALPTRLLNMDQRDNLNKDAAAIMASTNADISDTMFSLGASIGANGVSGQEYLRAKKDVENASVQYPGADVQLTKDKTTKRDKHLIIIGSNAFGNTDAVLLQLGNAANAVFGDTIAEKLVPCSQSTLISNAIKSFSSNNSSEYDSIVNSSGFGSLDVKQKNALLFAKLYMREVVKQSNPTSTSLTLPFPEVTLAEPSLGDSYTSLVDLMKTLVSSHANRTLSPTVSVAPTGLAGLQIMTGPNPVSDRRPDLRLGRDNARFDREGRATEARDKWKANNAFKIPDPTGTKLPTGTNPRPLSELKAEFLTKNQELDALVHFNVNDISSNVVREMAERKEIDPITKQYTYAYPKLKDILDLLMIYPSAPGQPSTIQIQPSASTEEKDAWRTIVQWSINNRFATTEPKDPTVGLTEEERTNIVDDYYTNLNPGNSPTSVFNDMNDMYSVLAKAFEKSNNYKQENDPGEYARKFKAFLDRIPIATNSSGAGRSQAQIDAINEVKDSVSRACGKL